MGAMVFCPIPQATSECPLFLPWLSEVTDTTSLKMYFYNALLTEEAINARRFTVLQPGRTSATELETARNTENLSLTDYMLVGMAYQLMGETTIAREIYSTRIKPHLEIMDPYIRIRVKNGDTDASLEQTALPPLLQDWVLRNPIRCMPM